MAKLSPCLPLLLAAGLAGCTVGPDYHRPAVAVPAHYAENGPWQPVKAAAPAAEARWWEVFGDPTLDALEARVQVSNQTLKAAEAQYRQALALAVEARAGLYPTLGASMSLSRNASSSAVGVIRSGNIVNNVAGSLQAAWAPDVWGRIRRQIEAGAANAQASAADLAGARLSLQAQLAQNYFSLRLADAQRQLLEKTAAADRDILAITRNQYASGIVSQASVAQAEAQYKSAQAQVVDAGVARAQYLHAIAVLIGEPASIFQLDPIDNWRASLPAIPPGLPSQLLQRRPDIAASERQMAAANAQIGVAEAAWYPSFTFSANGGLQAPSLAQWLSAPARFWSLGPALTETLLDGGLRRAQTAAARAAYEAAEANYRQTVLGAFQQVEDNLSALGILAKEAALQKEALDAARRSYDLTMNQYRAGIVGYINVLTAQSSLLASEKSVLTVAGQRQTASIALIQALGGRWN